jgi:hypothetical protein
MEKSGDLTWSCFNGQTAAATAPLACLDSSGRGGGGGGGGDVVEAVEMEIERGRQHDDDATGWRQLCLTVCCQIQYCKHLTFARHLHNFAKNQDD